MSLNLHDLDFASFEEIDANPNGVVLVDGEGRIVTYNQAEARLSGRDPREVIGRNFFREVAPCTNCATFYGRFLERDGSEGYDRRFEFDFNFRVEPVRVEVRMIASVAHPGHTWILIRPLRVLGPANSAPDEFASMPTLDAVQPELRSELDLERCASEQIHTCATIQPHGVLMTVDPERKVVLQVSDNCEDHLGQPLQALLGSSIDVLLPADVAARVLGVASESCSPNLPLCSTVHLDGIRFVVLAYRQDGLLVLEWIPEFALLRQRDPGQTAAELAAGLHAISTCRDLERLDATFVGAVRRLASYERALVYEFLEDGSGVVIAEERAHDRLADYVGVHFPESDIPVQARTLYTKSSMRYVPNLAYRPAAIVPERVPRSGAPLDLTYSQLRSLSPNHRSYHQSIGVAASLSISLMRDGRLWGLLICHHSEPLYLDAEIRFTLGALAEHYSLQREVIERRLREQTLKQRREAFAVQRAGISCASELLDAVAEGRCSFLELFGATGMAISLDGRLVVQGLVPSMTQVHNLISFLGRTRSEEVVATDRLPELWPAIGRDRDVASGLLAISLGRARGESILLFRQERPQRIRWGSPPHGMRRESRAADQQGFEIAEELCQGRAAPWPDWAVSLARVVRHEAHEWVLGDLSRIRQLADRADHSTRARDDLLSNFSHELRTPLAAVLGAGDLMAQTELSPEQRELLEIDRRSAGELARKMDLILDYSQLRSGVRDLETEPFDVVAAVSRSVDRQRRLLGAASGIVLEASLPASPCWIVGSPERVDQVVRELLANACRFTEAGRVELAVTVETDDASGNQRVLVEVTDSGPGLPESPMRLFEPFAQGDSSTRRRHAGLGLGLAVSKLVVEAMGGRIGARPAPKGRGAQFWFTVDFEPAAPIQVAPPQDKPRLNVLYVDDEPLNRRLFAGMLGRRGHDVTCCASGAEGVEAARRSAFDVIVLDIQMPGMDGAEVCGVLLDELQVTCPIVALSADSLAQRIEQCFRVGFQRYLTKPVRDWGALESELRSLAGVGAEDDPERSAQP